jgi:hypothetical protein
MCMAPPGLLDAGTYWGQVQGHVQVPWNMELSAKQTPENFRGHAVQRHTWSGMPQQKMRGRVSVLDLEIDEVLSKRYGQLREGLKHLYFRYASQRVYFYSNLPGFPS